MLTLLRKHGDLVTYLVTVEWLWLSDDVIVNDITVISYNGILLRFIILFHHYYSLLWFINVEQYSREEVFWYVECPLPLSWEGGVQYSHVIYTMVM